jgi:hypothetical protein
MREVAVADPSLVRSAADALRGVAGYLNPVGSLWLAAASLLAFTRRDRRELGLTLVSLAWFAFFVVVGHGRWRLRYFLPGCLPLLVVAAGWLSRAAGALGRRWRPPLPGGLSAAVPLAFGLAALPLDCAIVAYPEAAPLPAIERSAYVSQTTSGYGVAELAEWLRRYARQQGREISVIRDARWGPHAEGLELELWKSPAPIRFVSTYFAADDLPDRAEVAWSPRPDLLIRQVVVSTPPAGEFEAWRLERIATIVKAAGCCQFEVYRVRERRTSPAP